MLKQVHCVNNTVCNNVFPILQAILLIPGLTVVLPLPDRQADLLGHL